MGAGLPLFVYGTLLSGASRAGVLTGLGRRPAKLHGRLYQMPAGYPALELGSTSDAQMIHGELVDAPGNRLLGLLDYYEGVEEGLFTRVDADVIVGLRAVRAWVYTMGSPRLLGGVPLKSNVWRECVRR